MSKKICILDDDLKILYFPKYLKVLIYSHTLSLIHILLLNGFIPPKAILFFFQSLISMENSTVMLFKLYLSITDHLQTRLVPHPPY